MYIFTYTRAARFGHAAALCGSLFVQSCWMTVHSCPTNFDEGREPAMLLRSHLWTLNNYTSNLSCGPK